MGQFIRRDPQPAGSLRPCRCVGSYSLFYEGEASTLEGFGSPSDDTSDHTSDDHSDANVSDDKPESAPSSELFFEASDDHSDAPLTQPHTPPPARAVLSRPMSARGSSRRESPPQPSPNAVLQTPRLPPVAGGNAGERGERLARRAGAGVSAPSPLSSGLLRAEQSATRPSRGRSLNARGWQPMRQHSVIIQG